MSSAYDQSTIILREAVGYGDQQLRKRPPLTDTSACSARSYLSRLSRPRLSGWPGRITAT